MKTLLRFMLIAFCCFPTSFSPAKDANLAESFYGTWETWVENSNDTKVFMRVLYRNDGTCYTHVEFTIKSSLTLVADVEELWEVVGETIHYKITKTTNKEMFGYIRISQLTWTL